mmetsp:Transcript_32050/g.68588  ORF Transcript_32050/g.68588 Transcript_32050/m.68588 type:complete len:212 (+) Transcript_32050:394-1029(+)
MRQPVVDSPPDSQVEPPRGKCFPQFVYSWEGVIRIDLVPRGDATQVAGAGFEAAAEDLGFFEDQIWRNLDHDVTREPRPGKLHHLWERGEIEGSSRRPFVPGARPIRLHDALLDVPISPVALADVVQGGDQLFVTLTDAKQHTCGEGNLQLPRLLQLPTPQLWVLRGCLPAAAAVGPGSSRGRGRGSGRGGGGAAAAVVCGVTTGVCMRLA